MTIDERSLAEADRILRAIPGAAQRVLFRSLNRAVSSSRTLLSRRLAARLKVNKGDVQKRLPIRKANRNYLRATLNAEVSVEQVINLGAQQTEAGVTYRPFGGKKRRLIAHAFIARGLKRGTQVWLRSRYVLGRPKFIDWRDRRMEALYLQKEPPISSLIEPEDRRAVTTKASEILPKEINQRMGYELQKWNKR